ncbi:MAG: hypothetical protein WDN04_09345 [Rhodospirillales bacterium]
MSTRGAALVRFYRLLDELQELNGGLQRLANAGPEGPWPRRGVVWFFEKGETRRESGDGPRVVRVGTHALKAALKSTLWDRLAADASGAHRGSQFRTFVGLALRDVMGRTEPQSWGRGADTAAAGAKRGMDADAVTRAEAGLEAAVSLYVGQMPFLFLAVDDSPGPNSQRAVIEKNSIALLSNYARPALDAPSKGWLGRRCSRDKVPQSGLWNTQHVDAAYDPSFMDSMKSCMEEMRQTLA